MEEEVEKTDEKTEEEPSDIVSSDVSSLEEEGINEEEKKDGKVSYSRFQKIHSRMKEAETRLDEAERELEYYRSLRAKSESLPVTTEVEPEEEFDWEKPHQTVKTIVNKTLQQQLPQLLATEVRKEKARIEALDRFPELSDPKSQFFKQTAYQLERLGLTKHPEGALLAASVVAVTQMPEVLGRMKAQEERLRKENLGFVEGSSRRIPEEEFTLPSEHEILLDKLGIPSEGKKEIARRLAKGGR